MAYRRSIFIINKPFQFRFAFYVCSWLVAVSFVYPLIIHNLFELFFRYLSRDPSGPPIDALLGTRRDILTLLISLQVILLLITFLISLFMSHRIAGPLFKLKQFFARTRDGDFSEQAYFRKSDHFQDLAGSFNEMNVTVKKRLQINAHAIEIALKELESSGNRPEALKLLKEAAASNSSLKF